VSTIASIAPTGQTGPTGPISGGRVSIEHLLRVMRRDDVGRDIALRLLDELAAAGVIVCVDELGLTLAPERFGRFHEVELGAASPDTSRPAKRTLTTVVG
jgi:hypothetical protein